MVRKIIAVILGFVLGSIVNLALVTLGSRIIPAPAGVDVNDMKSLAAGMHLFQAHHFLFPFLAHALGTFVGAITAYLVAPNQRALFAYILGALFLAGGIAACVMIPAPAWFMVLDLTLSYMPMAWLATVIGRRFAGTSAT